MKRSHVDVQQEYARWDKAHKQMTHAPPSEGHRYIQHALNLLDLLEPIAELHPVAKMTVGCFKQLVSFEQDRRENDARVAGVILAQTAMMRVLLDLDDLTSRQHPSTLRAMEELPHMLHIVQEDITICHNNIDTYYREHRLVKFCKAKNWKAKMLEFIETFDRHRVELHQVLSLQVASDVSDLVSKMDTLLGRLFSPHEPWELVVSSRIRELNKNGQAGWMEDTQILRSLALATGDPSVKLDATSNLMETTKLEMQLNQLKEDLHLSIDVLSQRNTELFTLKLKLHTEQLERAISHSARFVISSLSGPHDRLENEDLRKLWKEMNWMFCVETKVFGIALFEYYLDLYSNGMFTSGFDTGLWTPKVNPIHRYKEGAFKHPQAWTLLYLFLYADKISNAIDSDNSGFIRINEVNAFTLQIPDGWTLPQWCQFHENAIYRKRLLHIRNILHELHAEILPDNRFSSGSFVSWLGTGLLHYLVLEPRGLANQTELAIAPELHELVKAKMLAQDAKFREMLQSIKWTIEDESTIEVLSSGRPLETYIFPLLLVIMEFWLDLHHLCKSEVLDYKEWIHPYFGILALRLITEAHIKALQKKFEVDKDKNSEEELRVFHRGTWALLQKTHAYNLSQVFNWKFDVDLVPLLQEDYDNLYTDLSFIVEFPLPELTGSLLQRKYSTWEEYTKDKDPLTLPRKQPLTWHPIDDEMNVKYVNNWIDLPTSG
ncbi:hypothetical protein D9619_000349 [Psilocybe cf. subviscida]|uniref:EF-hand domain-containing protein n=1 Tax=Psilocybe cf. subviscida TaxID=2480587 RepID=A0A8H5BDT3_9AGAR|nr:hypothetical protein D9619_000349 [Psilocybe cf. subviscida]